MVPCVLSEEIRRVDTKIRSVSVDLENTKAILVNPKMVSLPDNYNLNTLEGNGIWDMYSTDKTISNAPENGLGRLCIEQKVIIDINGIGMRIQTVHEWFYGVITITLIPRWWVRFIYLRSDGYLWTTWKEL